jgi:sugar/nucleoside kinase (ribokinase family)
MLSHARDFFAVGHITDDLEPVPHIGGGVSYSAVTAKNLGFNAHIITKAPPNHPYIKELRDMGINVHLLPSATRPVEDTITSFRNFYDSFGNRSQVVLNKQENIGIQDIRYFPEIPKGSVVLVAPVVGEVDVSLFPTLSELGRLYVTPQGYFRKIERDGKVRRIPWNKNDALKYAHGVILSDEDLTFDGVMDNNLLKRITLLCPITVLTEGGNGLRIYNKNSPEHVQPLGLREDEMMDFTGAGDSAAASFIWHFTNWGSLKEAAVFGALYPALKIKGVGGKEEGVHSLPTLDQIRIFTKENGMRILEFYKRNGIEKIPSFLELSGLPKEKR